MKPYCVYQRKKRRFKHGWELWRWNVRFGLEGAFLAALFSSLIFQSFGGSNYLTLKLHLKVKSSYKHKSTLTHMEIVQVQND